MYLMKLGPNSRRSSWYSLWITLALLGMVLAAMAAGIEESRAQTPVVPESDLLLEEHFDDGISRWTKFLNYWRLTDAQWYWGQVDGWNASGAANHECCSTYPEAHSALLMYLGDGAESWTDYRIEAKLNLHADSNSAGFWVRGQYEPSYQVCKWTTGYYVEVGDASAGDNHMVKIAQLQTQTDCWDSACGNTSQQYCFNQSHDLVEVELPGALTRDTWHTLAVEVCGANIKVWFDGELSLDYIDPKEPFLFGTVGLRTNQTSLIHYDDVFVTRLAPLSVAKSVWPGHLDQSGLVTYTVVLSNNSSVTGTVDLVTDTLDPLLAFVEMAAGSDVITPPQQITGVLVWAGPLSVPALGDLTLKYRVEASSSEPSRPCNRVEALSGDVGLGPVEACVAIGMHTILLPVIERNYAPIRAGLWPRAPGFPR